MQRIMSVWFQKMNSNKVTRLIEKYPPNKLRISITEITVQFLHVSQLWEHCAFYNGVQDKLQPFGFKQSVFCSCLKADSGQQANTAVAGLNPFGNLNTAMTGCRRQGRFSGYNHFTLLLPESAIIPQCSLAPSVAYFLWPFLGGSHCAFCVIKTHLSHKLTETAEHNFRNPVLFFLFPPHGSLVQ